MRKKGSGKSNNNPRQCGDLILFTAPEPCPMCLTRIINFGIQRMYWSNPDADGGDFRQAECSPELRHIAEDLFRHSMHSFADQKE